MIRETFAGFSKLYDANKNFVQYLAVMRMREGNFNEIPVMYFYSCLSGIFLHSETVYDIRHRNINELGDYIASFTYTDGQKYYISEIKRDFVVDMGKWL